MNGPSNQLIASGIVASHGSATGVLRHVTSLDRVLELMETDLSEVILSTLHASVTSIVPILPQVRGIVCQGGGATSHLAIVSRQFGLPCIVGAHFERPAEEVDGFELTMTEDGRVLLVQEPDE